MKFSIVLILLFGGICIASGQQTEGDLWRIWQDESEEGSSRLAAVHKIYITNYLYSKPDSAILLAQSAYDFAESLGLKKEMSQALGAQAIAYAAKGEYARSVEMKTKSEEIDESAIGTLQENLKAKQELLLLLYGLLAAMALFGILWLRKAKITQIKLEDKVKSLEKSLEAKLSANLLKPKVEALDKAKIERAIDAKLGESSWMILNLIFQNPTISNKDIANQISLSLEGVSSSLRRMYVAFDIKSNNNKKVALATEAARISAVDAT